MKIDILKADYHNPQHAQALVSLMDIYALDPMGGAQALAEEVRSDLVPALAKRSDAFSVLAFDGSKPIGLANCFEGFSTFACRPLINIHDIVVAPEYRGKGISKELLTKVEQLARERGCCKLTLEVLSGNHIAKSAYRHYGFNSYSLREDTGVAEFWEKKIS